MILAMEDGLLDHDSQLTDVYERRVWNEEQVDDEELRVDEADEDFGGE